MSLSAGTRLGPYEVLAPLGAGGMGEVYRAKDTRLDRTVALKVLPSHLSSDSELKQRLVREARAISSLSHPHICALYDVGSTDGVDYLVMEYLEGETLADRLGKGPLPPELVLRHGIEIAEALDRAHRQGVVHRDLKPANVMLTKSGVKLLDFGLAKLRVAEAEPVASNLPTRVASKPLTEKGTVLGTFQYMSPEQLEGKEADARSDIFALGTVLYEMATGRKAFTGASQASLIAAILASEPAAISTIQKMTPPALDRLVKRCLAKDADERWQSAKDVSAELRWIAEGGSQVGAPTPITAKRRARERLGWGIAGVLLVALAAVVLGPHRDPPAPASTRFALGIADGMALEPAFSPDGRRLAFVAVNRRGRRSLRLRELGSVSVQELPGTAGAQHPFWAPDGSSLGFFAERKLKRFPLPGGPVAVVCDAPPPRNEATSSGSWTRDGRIVFSAADGRLLAVPASGGTPAPLTTLDASAGEIAHEHPRLLPDGARYFYTAVAKGGRERTLVLASLASAERRHLPGVPANALYVSPGWLLCRRGEQLTAQRVDADTLSPRGDAIPLAERATGVFHAVDGRAVAYEVAAERSFSSELVWYDRDGGSRRPLGERGTLAGTFFSLEVSPDGRRVAYEKVVESSRNIWVLDIARGSNTRLTFGAALDDSPVFSPDGSRIAFDSVQSGSWAVYARAADGSGSETLLVDPGADDVIVYDWSRDGRFLLYGVDRRAKTGWDVWALPLSGGGKPFPVVETRFGEGQARLSPDSRWISYTSDESGESQVYVQSFPDGRGKVQVSAAGGSQAIWRRDGKELFYWTEDSRIAAVPILSLDARFEAGTPVPLFEIVAPCGPTEPRSLYSPSADGQRFLVNSAAERASPDTLQVLLNWAGPAR